MSETPSRLGLQQVYDLYLKLILLNPSTTDVSTQPESCSAVIESSRDQKKKLLQVYSTLNVDIKAKDRIPVYIAEILDKNIEKCCSRDWNQSKWIDLFGYFEEYAWNILHFPWKKEYHTILMFSGFYKTCIERLLPRSSEKVFGFLGYSVDEDNYKLYLTQIPDVNTLQKAAFDCFITQLEMQVQFDIVQSLANDETTTGPLAAEVYKARKKIGGSKQVCLDYMRQQFSKLSGGSSVYFSDSMYQFDHSLRLQQNQPSMLHNRSKTERLRPAEDEGAGLVNSFSSRGIDNRDAINKTLQQSPLRAEEHSRGYNEILTYDRSMEPDSVSFPTHRSTSQAQRNDIVNLVADDDLEVNAQKVKHSSAYSKPYCYDVSSNAEESLGNLRLDERKAQVYDSKSASRSATVATVESSQVQHHNVKPRTGLVKNPDSVSQGRSLLPNKTVQSSNTFIRATGGDVDVDGPMRQCKQPSNPAVDMREQLARGLVVAQPQSRDSDVSYVDSEQYVDPTAGFIQSGISLQSRISDPYLEANFMTSQRNKVAGPSTAVVPPVHAKVQPNIRNIKRDDQHSASSNTSIKSISEPIVPSLASRLVTRSNDSGEPRSQTVPLRRDLQVTSGGEQRRSDDWQCVQCTYLNPTGARSCEICEWERN